VLQSQILRIVVLALLASAIAPPCTLFSQGFPPAQTSGESEFFEPAETIARVGNEDIFRGDLEGDANVILIPSIEKIPPEKREEAEPQIKAQREQLVQRVLREAVQRKLMYTMFLRTIPADKLEEAKASIKERVGEQFNETLEELVEKVRTADESEYKDLSRQSSQLFRLAYLMKELDIHSFRELDVLLRRYGSSLEKQQQAYAEDQLGRQEMYQHARSTAEVTYDEMVSYYQESIDDFKVPTRARWEQITIAFDEFPTKFAAGAAIAKVGNELFFGVPFEQVAKRSSHGDKANKGGYHDWTELGSFKISREINDAVFSIDIDSLSNIIEDLEGMHIIRVIEREETHVIPFADAQTKIKEKIRGLRRSEAISEYLADLQEQIPVWTIYDEPEAAEQIADPRRESNVR
jgi:PPIC-type PPIASE domain